MKADTLVDCVAAQTQRVKAVDAGELKEWRNSLSLRYF